MNRTIFQSICALVMTVLLGQGLMAQVQFQVPLTVKNGTITQPLVIGVSGDGPGGVINDNTVGADTDTTLFGSFAEELAPPAPPAPFPFDARILTIPGRVATFPTGLGSGVYKDFRGWDSFLQVDSFRVAIDGENIDTNPTVVKWPSNLADFASAWVIKPQTGSEWGPVNMLSVDSVVIPAGVLQKNIIIIKTGAGPAGPVYTMNPSSLNFGVVPVGSSSTTQTVQVFNASTTNALSVTVTPNVNFTIVPANAVVPAGSTQGFDITFIPTTPGPGGNIEFTHNAVGSPSLLTVFAAGSDTSKFLTITPDTIIAKGANGKFLKSAKRGKGLAPNWANLLEEVVVQGGFQPLSSESDAAGGMVVGISHIENVGGKFKPIKDSAAVRGWVRMTKFDLVKGGKGYAEFQKSLEDKTGKHAGSADGFRFFVNGKPVLKQNKGLSPKKFNNKLYAELVALKFNIAASQLQKTPAGFGELVFDVAGNPFDALSVTEISAKADTMMTYYQSVSQETYDSLYSAIHAINRACLAPLDTFSFEAGNKLMLKGVLNATTYLKSPLVFAPSILTPVTDRVEEDSEFFDDGEFEDEALTPTSVRLYQNYPNPFNPSTTIAFRLLGEAHVNLAVYNSIGQEVATLLNNEEMEEGINTLSFDAPGLASGVYFYRITGQLVENGEALQPVVGKMMLLK